MAKDINEVSVNDLDDKYKWLAELIGLENLINLCDNAGGTFQYIPQLSNLLKNTVYSDIINDFDGYNIKQLVQKYKVSESTVRKLVKDKIKEKRSAPLSGQMSLYT